MSNEDHNDQHGQRERPQHGGWQPTPQGGEYDAEATAFVHLPPEDLASIPLAAPGQGYVPPMILPLTPAVGIDPAATGSWTVQTQSQQEPGAQAEQQAPDAVHWPDANQQPQYTYDYPQEQYGGTPAATGQWNFTEPAEYGGHADRSGQFDRPAPPDHSGQFDRLAPPDHGGEFDRPAPPDHSGQFDRPAPPDHSGQFGHIAATHSGRFDESGQAGPAAAPAAPTGHTGQWTIPVADGDLPEESGEFAASALASQWYADRTPPATLPGGAPAPWATPQPVADAEPEPLLEQQPPGTDIEPEHAPGDAYAPATENTENSGAPSATHSEAGAATTAAPHSPASTAPDSATSSPASPSPSLSPSPSSATSSVSYEDTLRAPAAEAAPERAAGGGAVSDAGEPPVPGTDLTRASATEASPAPETQAETQAATQAATPTETAPGTPAEYGTETPTGTPAEYGTETAPEQDPTDLSAETASGAEPDADADADPDADPDAPLATSSLDAPSEHPAASYVLHVNGADRPVTDAWIGESLLYVLRERLGLAGAKDGCSQGECGACNVQVDGRLVASCLVPAATAAGSEVRTVEGLAVNGEPSDVQRALARCGAVQCGFCIPGMAMTVHDLLEGNHAPSELETRQALCGNLCRCSGYRGVLDAVNEVIAGREATTGPAPSDSSSPASDEARIPHQAAPGAGSVQPHPQDGGMA
ncbi:MULTISPECIES: 2Fe-2S iron-sulfur cluster-binding protein [unclassified Streptomyces]|uniref:2Fe-2S iron-sulfur cluster-binding protein n=1 Tax=unclassified Streptomyces TaxID=2593676 RepID=UPI0036E3066D